MALGLICSYTRLLTCSYHLPHPRLLLTWKQSAFFVGLGTRKLYPRIYQAVGLGKTPHHPSSLTVSAALFAPQLFRFSVFSLSGAKHFYSSGFRGFMSLASHQKHVCVQTLCIAPCGARAYHTRRKICPWGYPTDVEQPSLQLGAVCVRADFCFDYYTFLVFFSCHFPPHPQPQI